MDMQIQEEYATARNRSFLGAQWLRAAGVGVLSTASLILGVAAVDGRRRLLVICGMAGSIGGSLSMGVGEFVSVSIQRDVQISMRREKGEAGAGAEYEDGVVADPYAAASASGLAFLCGGAVPIVSAMAVANDDEMRKVVVAAVASVASASLGGLGAYVGGWSSVGGSTGRMLVGGWVAMGITYVLLKAFGSQVYVPISE